MMGKGLLTMAVLGKPELRNGKFRLTTEPPAELGKADLGVLAGILQSPCDTGTSTAGTAFAQLASRLDLPTVIGLASRFLQVLKTQHHQIRSMDDQLRTYKAQLHLLEGAQPAERGNGAVPKVFERLSRTHEPRMWVAGGVPDDLPKEPAPKREPKERKRLEGEEPVWDRLFRRSAERERPPPPAERRPLSPAQQRAAQAASERLFADGLHRSERNDQRQEAATAHCRSLSQPRRFPLNTGEMAHDRLYKLHAASLERAAAKQLEPAHAFPFKPDLSQSQRSSRQSLSPRRECPPSSMPCLRAAMRARSAQPTRQTSAERRLSPGLGRGPRRRGGSQEPRPAEARVPRSPRSPRTASEIRELRAGADPRAPRAADLSTNEVVDSLHKAWRAAQQLLETMDRTDSE